MRQMTILSKGIMDLMMYKILYGLFQTHSLANPDLRLYSISCVNFENRASSLD
ncbi:hypothetical protein CFter6_3892 [Collimonas fungivorans]|uniref:Uncharacterized protein n=1 Tax=Collimonas fungivorans TaxID=158899 RepID=A0A127PFC7_9BURK|nr:hypothetical protein CFter6_3892 [Collimonas fungivorans]